MSCDIVIAAEGTAFAITPAKLGVPYDIEGTLSFMQSVRLPVVKEMLFTASRSNRSTTFSSASRLGRSTGESCSQSGRKRPEAFRKIRMRLLQCGNGVFADRLAYAASSSVVRQCWCDS